MLPAHAMPFRLFLTFITHTSWNAPFPAFTLLIVSHSEDSAQVSPPLRRLP